VFGYDFSALGFEVEFVDALHIVELVHLGDYLVVARIA